jgi:hypothetical protein
MSSIPASQSRLQSGRTPVDEQFAIESTKSTNHNLKHNKHNLNSSNSMFCLNVKKAVGLNIKSNVL